MMQIVGADLCHRICPYDRDLPHGISCTHSVFDFRKQRAEHDRAELFKVTVCTGLPGIFNHGVRRYLCSADPDGSIFNRYHRFPLGSHGLHDTSGIYTL